MLNIRAYGFKEDLPKGIPLPVPKWQATSIYPCLKKWWIWGGCVGSLQAPAWQGKFYSSTGFLCYEKMSLSGSHSNGSFCLLSPWQSTFKMSPAFLTAQAFWHNKVSLQNPEARWSLLTWQSHLRIPWKAPWVPLLLCVQLLIQET